MKRKVRVIDKVGQEVHPALTELLGLSDFDVLGYELHKPEGLLILFCVVKHEAAVCPDRHRVSHRVHEYRQVAKRDVSIRGLHCYLEYDHRRFRCDYCRKPFTKQLATVGFSSLYTRRYEHYMFNQYRPTAIQEIVRQEQ